MGASASSYLGAYLELINPFPNGPKMVKGCWDHGPHEHRCCSECGSYSRDFDNSENELFDLIGNILDNGSKIKPFFEFHLYENFNAKVKQRMILYPNAYELNELNKPCGAVQGKESSTFNEEMHDLQDMKSPAAYMIELNDSFISIITRLKEAGITVNIKFGLLTWIC